MKSKFLLCLALVLSGGLSGFSSVETGPKVSWLSYNGKLLLDRNHLWDIESGKEIRQFDVPPQITFSNGVPRGYGYVVASAISPDGKKVLTATGQFLGPERVGPGPVQLWDIASGRKLLEFKPDATLKNIRFFPDGKRLLLVSDSSSNHVQIWDAKNGERLFALPDFPFNEVVNFSPNGQLIATQGRHHQTLNIRKSDTGQKLFTIENTTNRVFESAQFSPDGKLILTADSMGLENLQGEVTNVQYVSTIWDAKSGRRIRDFAGYYWLFTPDGRKIMCAGENNTIILRDIKSGEEIRRFAIPDSFPKPDDGWTFDQTILSDDGKRLAVHYYDPSRDGTQTITALWSTDTGKLIKQFDKEDMMYWDMILGFLPKSEKLLLIGEAGKPELFDGATGQMLKTMEQYQQP